MISSSRFQKVSTLLVLAFFGLQSLDSNAAKISRGLASVQSEVNELEAGYGRELREELKGRKLERLLKKIEKVEVKVGKMDDSQFDRIKLKMIHFLRKTTAKVDDSETVSKAISDPAAQKSAIDIISHEDFTKAEFLEQLSKVKTELKTSGSSANLYDLLVPSAEAQFTVLIVFAVIFVLIVILFAASGDYMDT